MTSTSTTWLGNGKGYAGQDDRQKSYTSFLYAMSTPCLRLFLASSSLVHGCPSVFNTTIPLPLVLFMALAVVFAFMLPFTSQYITPLQAV